MRSLLLWLRGAHWPSDRITITGDSVREKALGTVDVSLTKREAAEIAATARSWKEVGEMTWRLKHGNGPLDFTDPHVRRAAYLWLARREAQK